ncbi:hypothetical protein C8Q79DRAFT_634109 [Trametes meyenii]|nr:hypothetical protein C8Q79DRAFT_634109 [Trametes meyenii]
MQGHPHGSLLFLGALSAMHQAFDQGWLGSRGQTRSSHGISRSNECATRGTCKLHLHSQSHRRTVGWTSRRCIMWHDDARAVLTGGVGGVNDWAGTPWWQSEAFRPVARNNGRSCDTASSREAEVCVLGKAPWAV